MHPGFCQKGSPCEQRAWGMPGARCTRSLVREDGISDATRRGREIVAGRCQRLRVRYRTDVRRHPADRALGPDRRQGRLNLSGIDAVHPLIEGLTARPALPVPHRSSEHSDPCCSKAAKYDGMYTSSKTQPPGPARKFHEISITSDLVSFFVLN